MPRRSPDQGVKPFEFRTGVGGLPALGGMFRSGDPATIPPQKFHLLVNIRRQPEGLITRPGLSLEFDTGVRECIQGLTEDSGLHGSAVLLYPGSPPRAAGPTSAYNAARFRAIFPDSSPDYSEFAFAIYGSAATTRGSLSDDNGGELSRPFIFRGQAVQFASVDRSGTPTVALLAINLPGRTMIGASDCQRDTAGPPAGADNPDCQPCPGMSGQAAPAGDDPPLWPYQYPVGSIGVLTYFDNPFSTDETWVPDHEPISEFIDQVITIQERVDDALTGTPGVAEVLYFVARRTLAGPVVERKLVRWDGANQANEAVTIPDDLAVALGQQAYGPYLVSGDLAAGPADWAAVKGESGAWSVIGGVGWTISPAEWATVAFLPRALSWGGKGQALIYGTWDGPGVNDYGGFVVCMQQGATDFEDARGSQSCTPAFGVEENSIPIPLDALVCGSLCYVIGYDSYLGTTGARLWCGDFRVSASMAVGDVTSPGVKLLDATSVSPFPLWIQSIGGRVYVGGHFGDWDPAAGAADVSHHGVYDVTDPGAIFNVYKVYDTDALEDSGGYISERYSQGALPAIPNDDDGGEGFQAS